MLLSTAMVAHLTPNQLIQSFKKGIILKLVRNQEMTITILRELQETY